MHPCPAYYADLAEYPDPFETCNQCLPSLVESWARGASESWVSMKFP